MLNKSLLTFYGKFLDDLTIAQITNPKEFFSRNSYRIVKQF